MFSHLRKLSNILKGVFRESFITKARDTPHSFARAFWYLLDTPSAPPKAQ
jgi:hypothetical protein